MQVAILICLIACAITAPINRFGVPSDGYASAPALDAAPTVRQTDAQEPSRKEISTLTNVMSHIKKYLAFPSDATGAAVENELEDLKDSTVDRIKKSIEDLEKEIGNGDAESRNEVADVKVRRSTDGGGKAANGLDDNDDGRDRYSQWADRPLTRPRRSSGSRKTTEEDFAKSSQRSHGHGASAHDEGSLKKHANHGASGPGRTESDDGKSFEENKPHEKKHETDSRHEKRTENRKISADDRHRESEHATHPRHEEKSETEHGHKHAASGHERAKSQDRKSSKEDKSHVTKHETQTGHEKKTDSGKPSENGRNHGRPGHEKPSWGDRKNSREDKPHETKKAAQTIHGEKQKGSHDEKKKHTENVSSKHSTKEQLSSADSKKHSKPSMEPIVSKAESTRKTSHKSTDAARASHDNEQKKNRVQTEPVADTKTKPALRTPDLNKGYSTPKDKPVVDSFKTIYVDSERSGAEKPTTPKKEPLNLDTVYISIDGAKLTAHGATIAPEKVQTDPTGFTITDNGIKSTSRMYSTPSMKPTVAATTVAGATTADKVSDKVTKGTPKKDTDENAGRATAPSFTAVYPVKGSEDAIMSSSKRKGEKSANQKNGFASYTAIYPVNGATFESSSTSTKKTVATTPRSTTGASTRATTKKPHRDTVRSLESNMEDLVGRLKKAYGGNDNDKRADFSSKRNRRYTLKDFDEFDEGEFDEEEWRRRYRRDGGDEDDLTSRYARYAGHDDDEMTEDEWIIRNSRDVEYVEGDFDEDEWKGRYRRDAEDEDEYTEDDLFDRNPRNAAYDEDEFDEDEWKGRYRREVEDEEDEHDDDSRESFYRRWRRSNDDDEAYNYSRKRRASDVEDDDDWYYY